MSPRSKASGRTVQLHLLRHADAGDPEAWHGPDEARPLSPKGQAQSQRLGAFLASVSFRPDAIVSSPKLRAAQTAQAVADALDAKVTLDDRLAGAFGLSQLTRLLEDLSVAKPVLVGHDPDFSGLLSELCGAEALEMKKGAFARIDLELPARPAGGTLRWLVAPDLLAAR
jgi:phosphohistidine phosphatase